MMISTLTAEFYISSFLDSNTIIAAPLRYRISYRDNEAYVSRT